LYKLNILPIVKEDIKAVRVRSGNAATQIIALLEQLNTDHDLLGYLLEHNHGEPDKDLFNVSKWQAYWQNGYDLWRLKLFNLENVGLRYRIIYAYALEKGIQTFYILAVIHRDFDYDPTHEITKRLIHSYVELGIGNT
jgi:hypothetical protein